MSETTIVVQFRGTIYENGYGQIAQKVMRDRSLSGTAKLIYSYIVSFAGQDGSAFPSIDLMMNDLGIKAEDTFYKHRKQLIDAGYITIEKQQRIKGKYFNNVYIIEVVPEKKAKKGEDSPYPKFSSTVESSTIKSGINNISISTKSESNISVCVEDEIQVIQDKAQESLEIDSSLYGDGEIKAWLTRYTLAFILDQIDIIREQGTENAIKSLRAAMNKPWSHNRRKASGNQKKSRTSQNTKSERVVPAVQDGKYERFYRVYGKTAQR